MQTACIVLLVTNLMGASVPIALNNDWTVTQQGNWQSRVDHRQLLAMRHPWMPSNKGDYIALSKEITIPQDWNGPVSLTFYCSDDYHTDQWRPDGSWLSAEGFIGHRYKRVLLGERAVWSEDVADPVEKGKSPRITVPLPVKPGQKCLITLLAYDAVESSSFLSQDFYQSPNNEKTRENDTTAANFLTTIYWGDLYLSCGDNNTGDSTPFSEQQRPTVSAVQNTHLKNWPIPPFSIKQNKPVTLILDAPSGIPKPGFPVCQGLPIPAKSIDDVSKISLTGPGSNAIYTEKVELATWLDESPQWALVSFVAKSGMDKLSLSFDGVKGKAPTAPKPPKITEEETVVTVASEPIGYTATRGALLSDLRRQGKPWINAVELSLRAGTREAAGITESIEVLERGPLRTVVQLRGKYQMLDASAGSWSLTLTSYAGLPYVTLWHRFFNDTAQGIPVSNLRAKFTLPEAPVSYDLASGPAPDGLVLRQASETARLVQDAPVDAAAPAFLAWPGGALTVRHFAELYPKELAAAKGTVTVDLVAGNDAPVTFTPGEAKSHEIWLSASGAAPAAFAATVAHPPVLQNAEYFCSTGVLGPAATHEGIPVLHDHMTANVSGNDWTSFGTAYGVRDFPDSAYHGGLPKWCNNYYERMLGLWSEWWMSGNRGWFDRAVEVCRHNMDVAVIHSDVPGTHWRGAIHGPGENHVAGPWAPNLRIAGLDLYYKLTGDTDARQAVVDVVDFCVRTKAGIDGGSVRDQAGPFDAICTGYALTGDIALLDAGSEYVRSALRSIDMRRGVWPDEHGSKVYRGNVPWMVAQAARPLYLWYRMTGDVDAAQALVALAESIVCENTLWDKPGEVSGYSHNPHYEMSSNYDLIIIPMIFAAYELSGDTFFRDAAQAQWERCIREKKFDSPLNCYWNTPWLAYYLKQPPEKADDQKDK